MIVIGWHVEKKTKGFVADYCEVCRDVTAFALLEEVQLSRFYALYCIPVDSHETTSHVMTCATCGTMYSTEATRYRAVAPEATNTVELIESTNPRLMKKHREVLVLRRRMADGLLSKDERAELLRETFTFVVPFLKAKTDLLAPFGAIGSGCLVTVLVAFIIGLCVASLANNKQLGVAIGVLIFLLAGLVSVPIAILLHRRATRVFVEREIHPLLFGMLKPLKPDTQELNDVLQRFGEDHPAIARCFRAETLVSGMNDGPTT
jgi:hypothetical protein